MRVDGLDGEGRLSLAYVAREKDRPKPPNRRQRRLAARGEDDPAGEGELMFFSMWCFPPCVPCECVCCVCLCLVVCVSWVCVPWVCVPCTCVCCMCVCNRGRRKD